MSTDPHPNSHPSHSDPSPVNLYQANPAHSDPPRVVIVDDQALVRAGFRMILASDGITVVGEAVNGAQAIDTVRRTQPDVVLMDIRMPEMDGLEATRRILSGTPSPPRILVLTTFDLDQYVYTALTIGASGFLLKDVSPEQLVAAVRLVQSGDALLAPSITRRLVERFASPDQPAIGQLADSSWPVNGGPLPDRDSATARSGSGQPGPGRALPDRSRPLGRHPQLSALTPRELEVLTLVAAGNTNAELAALLHLSEATVKTHVARILGKLGLRDRVQAVILAYQTGLVGQSQPDK